MGRTVTDKVRKMVYQMTVGLGMICTYIRSVELERVRAQINLESPLP